MAIVAQLNKIGGRNGIGRIDMVENRFVGMKSRGVYEAPGMTMLYAAHRLVEQLTLDRDLMHLRDRLAPEVAEMVYYGFWYTAKMDALMAFIREAQKPVTGEVTLELYKGNIDVAGRRSPNSLYDEGIASMEGGGSYNQTDAEGFLRIQGLAGPGAGPDEGEEVLTTSPPAAASGTTRPDNRPSGSGWACGSTPAARPRTAGPTRCRAAAW